METHPLEREAVGPAPRHPGPPLGILAIVFVVLFISSLVVSTVLAEGAHFPSPMDPEVTRALYFAEHPDAVLTSAFFQFGAAIPLGLFTATVVSRLQFLGIRAAGVFIALFGGLGAAFFALASALCQWVLAQPGVASANGVWQALQFLAFATGGPAHVVPFGLLVAGVSVTGGLNGYLSKWMMIFGLIIAALSELATFSLILAPAFYLLPIARLGQAVWIICTGFLLPTTRESGHSTTSQADPSKRGMHEAWSAP